MSCVPCHNRTWLIVVVAAIAWSAASPHVANSSVVRRIEFDDLSRKAAVVLAGRVVAVRSAIDPATGNVYTDARLALLDAIGVSSVSSGELTVRLPWGETPSRTQFVVGMPEIRAGDGIALFLESVEQSRASLPVGLWQGVFFLDPDPVTGEFRMRDAAGNRLVGIQDGKLISESARPARDWRAASGGISFSTFMEAVRGYRSTRGSEK